MIVAVYGSWVSEEHSLVYRTVGSEQDFRLACKLVGRKLARRRLGTIRTSNKVRTADHHVHTGFLEEWLASNETPEPDERCILVLSDETKEEFLQQKAQYPKYFHCVQQKWDVRFGRHMAGIERADAAIAIGGAKYTRSAITELKARARPLILFGTYGGAAGLSLAEEAAADPELEDCYGISPRDMSALDRRLEQVCQSPPGVDVGKGGPAPGLRSAFISYGGPDESFAAKLNNGLKSNGVSTWFFPDDAPLGESLHRVMFRGVRDHDRVILICSKHSLTRSGVLNELEQTLARESGEGGRRILIPVRLDDFVFDGDWADGREDLKAQIDQRVVADFRDQANFDLELGKLVRALRR